MSQPTLPAATRTVTALAVTAKAAGLVRTFVAARTLGTTAFADAYTAANAVPNVLVDVVANGVANGAVVPLQAASLARGRVEDADRAINAQLTWVAVITMPLMALGMLVRHWIARVLLGAGHDPAQLDAAARMLVILLLQVPLYGFGVVLSSALQARRRFVAPSIAPMLSSAVVTVTYLVFAATSKGRDLASVSRGSELLLVAGTSLGVVALTLPLLLPLVQTGFRVRPTLRLPDEHARGLVRLGAAGAIALTAQQGATVLTMRLASVEHGGVVIMNLALTVLLLPLSVVAVPLVTTALPELSASHATKDHEAFASLRTLLLRRSMWLGATAGALLALIAPLIAWLLLRSTPGDHGSVGQLARAIAVVAPAAIGLVICHAASRVAFAEHRGRRAALTSSSGWLLAAAAELVLTKVGPGVERTLVLALAMSIGFLLAATAALVSTLASAPTA